MAVNSLALEGVKNFSKKFANMYKDVPIAERIGIKAGIPLRVSL